MSAIQRQVISAADDLDASSKLSRRLSEPDKRWSIFLHIESSVSHIHGALFVQGLNGRDGGGAGGELHESAPLGRPVWVAHAVDLLDSQDHRLTGRGKGTRRSTRGKRTEDRTTRVTRKCACIASTKMQRYAQYITDAWTRRREHKPNELTS